MNVYYCTNQIGTNFRGEVIDSQTQQVVFRTPYTYADPQIAQMAAQRMYAARVSAANAREYADAHRGVTA